MNSQNPQAVFDACAHAGVMQDKSEALRDRPASDQPYRPADEIRANNSEIRSPQANHKDGLRANQERPRSNHPNGHPNESLVPLTTQIRRFVKAEIQRLAKQEKISDSRAAAAFLEQAVQGHIDMQYGAMLKPVIETTIERKIQSYSNRNANLALQAFYSAEQARILTIHILRFILGEGIEELPLIIAESQKQAWENMKHHLGDDEEEHSRWQ